MPELLFSFGFESLFMLIPVFLVIESSLDYFAFAFVFGDGSLDGLVGGFVGGFFIGLLGINFLPFFFNSTLSSPDIFLSLILPSVLLLLLLSSFFTSSLGSFLESTLESFFESVLSVVFFELLLEGVSPSSEKLGTGGGFGMGPILMPLPFC